MVSEEELIARLRGRELREELHGGVAARRYAPANASEVDRAEAQVGFSFPSLLRRIYLEIANGGFGPGYGLLGVAGGATSGQGDEIVKAYLNIRTLPEDVFGEPYPVGRLLIAEWGCATWAAIDALKEECPVFAFDLALAVRGDISRAFVPHRGSFGEWLEAWLNGSSMSEEATVLFSAQRLKNARKIADGSHCS